MSRLPATRRRLGPARRGGGLGKWRRASCALALVLSSSWSRTAGAADPVAEAAFQEGLRLLELARFEEACHVLEASHAMEPKSGTLVVLASCHAELGKTATAWAEYKEAAALARAEGRASHADKANELAAELLPRLSSLRIELTSPTEQPPSVRVDETAIPHGMLAIALPLDPGEHRVVAAAPGRRTWSQSFVLGPSEQRVVTIPTLELSPLENASPPPSARPAETPRDTPQPTPPMWPWVVGGAGLVALGASAVSLAVSRSASDELDDVCSEARNLCPLDYAEGPPRTAELTGFGLFVGFGIAGLAGVVTGLTGLALRPDAPATTRVSASPDHARLDVTMHF